MLKFAAICPHPPIIIPGIGNKNDLKTVKKTVDAMNNLADKIEEQDIDTIIIISPHGLVMPNKINISYYQKYFGNFEQFNISDIKLNFASNNELADEIHIKSEEKNIPAILFNNNENTGLLDHGCLVPLYYLTKNIGSKVKILPICYSFLSAKTHFNFGQIIIDIVNSKKFKDENIAVIASGDLSHRLFHGAPAGYSNVGKKFDKKLINDLKNKKINKILNYDQEWIESAGECGYRSILILLGTINHLNFQPKILSYEGPFGVGYLVANFELE